MEECPYCHSKLFDRFDGCTECLAYPITDEDEPTLNELSIGYMPDRIDFIEPQPHVQLIENGFSVSGVPHHSGTPEYHINNDERFGKRGRAFRRERDRVWMWRLVE